MAPIADEFARRTGVDVARVLRRAGYPPDFLVTEDGGIAAADYFAIWDAAFAEAGAAENVVAVARMAATGPFTSAVFAFACSPTVATGLRRLAVFKPLIGPMRLIIAGSDDGLTITKRSVEPAAPIPPTLGGFELAYLTELIRSHTDYYVVPRAAILNGPVPPGLERYLGVRVRPGPETRLEISAEDANRRLVSENRALWESFEVDLRRQLTAHTESVPLSTRVRSALLELLPAGDATADSASRHLHMSRRSLQRRLAEEGTNFKEILDRTRIELARHYLQQPDLRVEEIGYLLAYRDPNSFYRAFNSWTGQTPKQARTAFRKL